MLKDIDFDSSEKIHPNNVRRVIRAIEIYKTTGKTMTEANIESKQPSKYDSLVIGLTWDREVLNERINLRVNKMIQDGLLYEVENIIKSGVSKNSTSMQAIGYKEVCDFLDGECSFDLTVEKIKQESRRYAKRQMTWLRRNKNINWILLQDDYNLNKICKYCFTLIEKFGIIKL